MTAAAPIERLAAISAGTPSVGDREQILSLLTTGTDGFALNCALSRNEVEVDGDDVFVAVHARRTTANIDRTGCATLVAFDDESILSFRLSARRSLRHADVLAVRFEVTGCEIDTLHIALTPATFEVTSHVVDVDRWHQARAAIAAMRMNP